MWRLLLLFVLIQASSSALACSCAGFWSEEEAYARSESVAVVRISVFKQTADASRASGVVEEQFKGRKTKKVKLVGESSDSSCYDELLPGERYVVFWSGRKAHFNVCNRQPLLSTVPTTLIQAWRDEP